MSQERRRHLGSHRFDVISTEPLETEGSTALVPAPQKPGILQRWFGGGKKVYIKKEDPSVIQFKEAVSAVGVDLDSQLSRPPIFANTSNIRVLPVRMKQAEDVHEFDEDQVVKTLESFKAANAKLPEDQRLPIGIIADGLATGNKGKITEFEAEKLPFEQIPANEDIRTTENGVFAYQVVSERVINLLPSPEVQNRLELLKGNQLVAQEENTGEQSKALSTVVVIKRNAKSIDPQQAVVEIAEPLADDKAEIEAGASERPENIADFGPFITPIAQGQIQRLDTDLKKVG